MSLPKNIFKSTGIYASANLCNKAVGFLMLPLYTRFLTPEDYGVVALLVFTTVIFQTLFGVRLGLALPRFYHEEKSKGDEKDANLVISSALVLTTVGGIFLSILLLLFSTPISTIVFGKSDYSTLSALFFVTILPQAIEVYGLVYLRICNKAKLYLYLSISKLLIQVVLNIYLIMVLELGAFGIVLSTLIASCIFGLILGLYLISKVNIHFNWPIAKNMIFFCWPLWFSSLAAFYIWTSNRYFVRIYGSLEDVGLIELAAKFSSILIAIFWEPFMLYWSTERYNIYYKKSDKSVYQRTFEIALVLLSIGVLGISLFSEFIIMIMADPSFHGAIVLIPALVLGSMFYALAEFNNLGFMVHNKTLQIAYIDLATAVLLSLLFVLLIPKFGLIGASYAMLIAQFIQFQLYRQSVKKYFDMGLKMSFLIKIVSVVALCVLLSKCYKFDNILLDIASALFIFVTGCLVIFFIFIKNAGDESKLILKKFGIIK